MWESTNCIPASRAPAWLLTYWTYHTSAYWAWGYSQNSGGSSQQPGTQWFLILILSSCLLWSSAVSLVQAGYLPRTLSAEIEHSCFYTFFLVLWALRTKSISPLPLIVGYYVAVYIRRQVCVDMCYVRRFPAEKTHKNKLPFSRAGLDSQ